MSGIRRGAAQAGRVLAWAVLLSAAAALTVAVVVPRIGGGTPYSVLTGSMQPDLPPGTLVVMRPAPFEQIGIGDVITYQLDSGKPTVVTHRVVGIGVNVDGERVLSTKGDANEGADPKAVREVQVKGELWYSAPQLGHMHQLLTGQQRQWGVYAVVVMLLGYAAMTWGSALKDRLRQREERDDEATTPYAPTPA